MLSYEAPLDDIRFLLEVVEDYEAHCERYSANTAPAADDVRAILESVAAFAQRELLLLNQSADREGCAFDRGEVTTPRGFRAAYDAYCEAGLPGLTRSTDHGGMGLPDSLGLLVGEVIATANWSWSMYPGLAAGAIDTLEAFGNQRQREWYLRRLVSGEWTATMCLTEPQCGSDLAQVRCRAEPDGSGGWRLSGTKIFITAGQHDLTENIVHIVLARLPDAPRGTSGLSLFIVPRERLDQNGAISDRNGVVCGGIEDKMGLKASATCTMHFDQAHAELLGEPHQGLAQMFIFMNTARISAGQQGVAHAELGYQNSLHYARERLAGRSALATSAAPHPILAHMDVRRLLLTQRAFAEGGRALIADAALQVDIAKHAESGTERAQAEQRLALVTPIIKGFLTETGVESANHAMQCLGGHGYMREWGLEQNLRDARIATIYEGTTAIQGIDLLARKVIRDELRELSRLVDCIKTDCLGASQGELVPQAQALQREAEVWLALSEELARTAQEDPLVVAGVATDYLMYSGYVVLAHHWLRMGNAAVDSLETGTETDFLRSKVATTRFYFDKLFPRTESLRTMIRSGATSIVAREDAGLALAEVG